MSSGEGTWRTSHVQEISLPSNLVNFLNFIVFNVFLISLVFHFTTEISGRLNYLALSSGSSKSLKISCPPIVGGGLCSTSPARFYFLLSIRIFSFLLIFASDLAIDGRSVHVLVERNGLRSVPGPIINLTNAQYREAINRRASCQNFVNGFTYFGELRENDICESNIALLTEPVSLRFKEQVVTINTGKCHPEDWNFPKLPLYTYRNFRCVNALIQCIIHKTYPVGKQRIPAACRGVVRGEGETHVCEGFSKIQGDNWTGSCRVIRNHNLTNDFWLPGVFRGLSTIAESIGATTIAENANRTLKYYENTQQVTQVHHAWFALLGTIILLVLVLGCFTAYLIWVGAKCVVHDERSLASLLTVTASRYGTSVRDDSNLYMNATTNDNKITFWVSKDRFRNRANEDRHMFEEAIVMGQV